jgi:hypothetical protein
MQEDIKYAYSPKQKKCLHYEQPLYGLLPAEECIEVYADNGPLLVLWGDSHAGHYGSLFNRYAERNNINFLLRSMGACFPSLNHTVNKEFRDDCTRFNTLIVAELKRLSETKQLIVVLSGWWPHYTNEKIITLNLSNELQGETDQHFSTLEKSIESTVNFLKSLGAQVILIKNTPNFNVPPLKCLAEQKECKGFFEPIYFLNNSDNFKGKAKILDFNSVLCPERKNCDIVVNNKIAYRDREHLTSHFTYSLIDLLELQMK